MDILTDHLRCSLLVFGSTCVPGVFWLGVEHIAQEPQQVASRPLASAAIRFVLLLPPSQIYLLSVVRLYMYTVLVFFLSSVVGPSWSYKF